MDEISLIADVTVAMLTLAAVWLAYRVYRQAERTADAAMDVAERTAASAERAARSEIMLIFDERFAQFDHVNKAFRDQTIAQFLVPDADGLDQWSDVDKYLGMFERIHSFVEQGLFDIGFAWDFYGHRYVNVVKSEIVRERCLVNQAQYWYRFTDLGWQMQRYLETSMPDSKRNPEQEPGHYLALIPASDITPDPTPPLADAVTAGS